MLEAMIARWGYAAVTIGTFLEGETILLSAGAFAHRGLLSLPWVMFAAFVGSTLGDLCWFLLGRKWGERALLRRPSLARYKARIEGWLARGGTLFVLGFRFLYGVRTAAPALLGASGYPWQRFVLLNVLGSALWSVTFGALGFGMGAALAKALGRATHVEETLLVALALTLVLAVVVRTLRKNHVRGVLHHGTGGGD